MTWVTGSKVQSVRNNALRKAMRTKTWLVAPVVRTGN